MLAAPKRASLIVLNFEGLHVIESCIDSLAEAAGVDDEIIVVDNASTDGSREWVEGRAGIHLVSLPQNTYIFGLNRGLAVAAGKYVAFLNNDMTVAPDFVDRCLDRFGDGDDVFAVCPRIIMSGRDQGSRTTGSWRRGLIFYHPLPHSQTATDCFFAVGGQSFFRRDMLEEIGSIDPLLWPMYHEDIELSFALGSAAGVFAMRRTRSPTTSASTAPAASSRSRSCARSCVRTNI